MLNIFCTTFLADLVKIEIRKTKTSTANDVEVVEISAKTQPVKEGDIWEFLDDKISSSREDCTGLEVDGIPMQLREYLKSKPVCRKANSNPFLVWQTMENEFYFVSKVAKKILSVVATSVPSERLFSHAGIIATQLRNRISPDNLNMLVFLRSTGPEMWFNE